MYPVVYVSCGFNVNAVFRSCSSQYNINSENKNFLFFSLSTLRGQTPAEADLNLLETARRCELYGMKMHQAKDIEGVPLNLAVAHMGIAVFQGITRINTFSWAKIRKISFKRKRFLVKLHPEGYVSICRRLIDVCILWQTLT